LHQLASSAVYYHGGGFVIATIDTYDASARALCNGVNMPAGYFGGPEAQELGATISVGSTRKLYRTLG
jgi:hypothetical protein